MIAAVVFSTVGTSYFLYKFWNDYKNKKLDELPENISAEEFLNLKEKCEEYSKNLQEHQINIATLNTNIENFKKTIEDKEIEIQKQKDEIKIEREKLSTNLSELSKIKSINEHLIQEQKEHQFLKQKYQETEEQRSQFQAQKQELENYKALAEEKLNELKIVKENLKNDSEKLKEKSQELTRINTEHINLEKIYNTLKEKCVAFEKDYAATQEQKSQFNALNQTIKNITEQREEKNVELQETNENLKNAEKDLKNKIERLTKIETEYSNLQNFQQQLQEKYSLLKEKHKQYELDKHELDLFQENYDEYKIFYDTCNKKYEVNLEKIEELKNFYNKYKEQAEFWNRTEELDNVLKGKDYEQKLKLIVENSFSSDELKTVDIIEQPKAGNTKEKGDLAIEFYEHEHKDPKNHKNLSIFIEAKWGRSESTEDGREMTTQYDKTLLKTHLSDLFKKAKKFHAHFAWLVTNKIVDNESFKKDGWQWFCAKKDYEDHGIDNWDCELDPKIIILNEEKLSPLVQALYRDNKFKKHRPNIHSINVVTLQQDVAYITKINEAYVKNWKEYFVATKEYIEDCDNFYSTIKKAVENKSLKKTRQNFEIKNEICEKTVTSMEMLDEKLSKNTGNSDQNLTNYLSFEEKQVKETEIYNQTNDLDVND